MPSFSLSLLQRNLSYMLYKIFLLGSSTLGVEFGIVMPHSLIFTGSPCNSVVHCNAFLLPNVFLIAKISSFSKEGESSTISTDVDALSVMLPSFLRGTVLM